MSNDDFNTDGQEVSFEQRRLNSLKLLMFTYGLTSFPENTRAKSISSLLRYNDDDLIYDFINDNIFKEPCMNLVYQMYRILLKKGKYNTKFRALADQVATHYHNEVINKMRAFEAFRDGNKKPDFSNVHTFTKPTLFVGDSETILKNFKNGCVSFIFTSPPYYNARTEVDYPSYQAFLDKMKAVFVECQRVLEDGRYIAVNVSPMIVGRPGREYESIRYPIHFDFHTILKDAGFTYVDDITLVKPEEQVPNRNGIYFTKRTPLTYKPNCVTESVLVYRKNADFLIDKNIARYNNFERQKNTGRYPSSNCWYIKAERNKNHPAITSKELCRRLVCLYSCKGDTVLDPFAGIGTFGNIAYEQGRIPVLCEIDKKYANRINNNHVVWYDQK